MTLVKYKRSETETVYGSLVSGSLDCGDYGVSETMDMYRQGTDEILRSCPMSKIEEISEVEYLEMRLLCYGY